MVDYPAPEQVKPFLLHEDNLVRQNVAAYFRDACSEDEDLLPLVVEFCKRYGERESLAGLEAGRRFKQSGESVTRVLELLKRLEDELTIYVLNDILAAMHSALFRLCQMKLRRAANVFPSTINVLCQRLALADRHPGELWNVLEHFIESFRGKECPDRISRTYAENLVEGLVPHAEQDVPSVKTCIERLAHSSGRDDWGALYIIDLLGKRRIKEAIPVIIDCFRFDSEQFGEHASEALIRIGDVEAIRILRERMRHQGEDFKYHATDTLAGLKHPEAEQALIDLLETEENALLRTRYCEKLCSHYSVKGEGLVRRQIETAASVDGAVLKAGSLVTSIIRSRDFSKAETWREELENPQWDREDFQFEPEIEAHFTLHHI